MLLYLGKCLLLQHFAMNVNFLWLNSFSSFLLYVHKVHSDVCKSSNIFVLYSIQLKICPMLGNHTLANKLNSHR